MSQEKKLLTVGVMSALLELCTASHRRQNQSMTKFRHRSGKREKSSQIKMTPVTTVTKPWGTELNQYNTKSPL